MNKLVWETPVPSSSFLRGVQLEIKPARTISLSFEYESESGQLERDEVLFEGVVEYAVTYLNALRVDQIKDAYDRLLEVQDRQDLVDVKAACNANDRKLDLHLYEICFDDGPCYKVACERVITPSAKVA